MLICIFIYLLIYCFGQSISVTKTILNSSTAGGRYLFVPSAIFLTIIFSYYDYLIKNNSRLIFLVGILILLILYNFVSNKKSNMLIIRNIEWNSLSKFYDKNGTNNLKIKIPPDWNITIPSNNLAKYNSYIK